MTLRKEILSCDRNITTDKNIIPEYGMIWVSLLWFCYFLSISLIVWGKCKNATSMRGITLKFPVRYSRFPAGNTRSPAGKITPWPLQCKVLVRVILILILIVTGGKQSQLLRLEFDKRRWLLIMTWILRNYFNCIGKYSQ